MSDNTNPTGNESHDKAIAEIWALFKKSEERADARQAKADARQAEADARQAKADARQAKIDAQLAEISAQQARTDEQLAKTSKEVAKLTRKLSRGENQWGKIAESLVGGELIILMKERFGVILDDVALHMKGTYNNKQWEIDVIGVNSDIVVIVEVKTTLSTSDTKEFISNIVRRFPKLVKRHEKSKIYAGIAYVKTGSNEADVVKHAEDNGLFVIKVINNTNKIVNSADFKLHDQHPDR